MRGKKGKFFYLQLSFIGIYLLGAIACGIGLLWVIPYILELFRSIQELFTL